MTDILEQAGIDTICARTDRIAYDALRRLGPFEALFVDINLGVGTTGFDVARAARNGWPYLHVVYVSGEADTGSFRTFGVPGSEFLFKPFSAGELLHALKLRPSPDRIGGGDQDATSLATRPRSRLRP